MSHHVAEAAGHAATSAGHAAAAAAHAVAPTPAAAAASAAHAAHAAAAPAVGHAAEAAAHAAGHAAQVSGEVTLLFSLVLAAMILCLALEEKLHAKKSIIVGVFAVIALFLGGLCGILPAHEVHLLAWNGHDHAISMPVYIPAIDWEVMAILIGASIFVDVSSKSGLFTWIAIKVTKKSGGDPLRLLWYYAWMTVVFSAVLNNVTAMIIIGSLTAVSLRKLEREDLMMGFLLTEGLLTNIGGLLTLISSVPNILVGQAAGIPFVKFTFVAAPYVLVATSATVKLASKMFGVHALSDEAAIEAAAEQVAGFDENDQVESRRFFRFSAASLVMLILFLASASILPVISDLGMGYVCLSFAAMMLLLYRHEVEQFYSQLDWDLMAFFGCLFVVINVAEHAAVLDTMGTGIKALIGWGDEAGPQALLWASAVASSVTDNVPLAAVLAKILKGLGTATDSKLWWAVIFGANMGGNLTPIGSASTVVAVTIMSKHKVGLTFGQFVVKAGPFALVQLVLASVYLFLVLGLLL